MFKWKNLRFKVYTGLKLPTVYLFTCAKARFLRDCSKYQVMFCVLQPSKIKALMIMLLTVEVKKSQHKSTCIFGCKRGCWSCSCWQPCSIRLQQNWIHQSALCFQTSHSATVTTAQLKICQNLFPLSLSHNISSSWSHTQANAPARCYFSSHSLCWNTPLGRFFDSSLLIECDNFTARCWRRDHLLINLGHAGNFPFFACLFLLLSTHTLQSKNIHKHTAVQQSWVKWVNL